MMIALLSITLAMVAWKWRTWYDEVQAELSRLNRRIEELERRSRNR